MKLFSLLIGINKYTLFPLTQCVSDAEKMETYLNGISKHFSANSIKKLLDEEATKEKIISELRSILNAAGDDDVVLIYYSGHGAYEKTVGLFDDEQDDMLECMVPYFDSSVASNTGIPNPGFLLADKELRYILSQTPNNPHLVTIFDSCHSGDIVRAFDDSKYMVKRLANPFPQRAFKDFIFSSEWSEQDFRDKRTADLLGYKNHIHLAACLSSESSWEGPGGGVFTGYLLKLLEASKGQLNYQEIIRWGKMSLQDMTKVKQTPVISIQGEGKLNAYSPWLNMFPAAAENRSAAILYNEKAGWNISRGQLMGMKPGIELELVDGETRIPCVVESVGLEYSKIKPREGSFAALDTTRSYEAEVKAGFPDLKVFVNDLDHDADLKAKVEAICDELEGIERVVATDADFSLNLFNKMVYFSLPGHEFRPLAKQIDVAETENNLKNELVSQIKTIRQWNHFDKLENPDRGFDTPPIMVKIKRTEDTSWTDATNTTYKTWPRQDRMGGVLYQLLNIEITNVSKQTLYVGVLGLSSDFGVSTGVFDGQVVELAPGKSKAFYDHRDDGFTPAFMAPYQEFYNWPFEWFHYKFIVNNFEDFTAQFKEYEQPGLPTPLTPSSDDKKGMGFDFAATFSPNKWGTYKTTVELGNPGFGTIPQEAEKNWTAIMEDARIAPFIGQLYFDQAIEGLNLKTSAKPRISEDEQKGLGIGMFIGNTIENLRRERMFKAARNKMPNKPIIVAEGDSWFLYPFFVKDTLDFMMEEYPVRSLAWAGDTLENYKKTGQLLKTVTELRPKIVMISGGGNDIIGPEIVGILNKGVPAGSPTAAFLNADFPKRMDQLKAFYGYFFDELKKIESVQRVLVHGYAYVRANPPQKVVDNGWVNKHMIAMGIGNATDREKVIHFLIDTFNQVLSGLAAQYAPLVKYVDMRPLVQPNEWYDEIHPVDAGFGKIANAFKLAI